MEFRRVYVGLSVTLTNSAWFMILATPFFLDCRRSMLRKGLETVLYFSLTCPRRSTIWAPLLPSMERSCRQDLFGFPNHAPAISGGDALCLCSPRLMSPTDCSSPQLLYPVRGPGRRFWEVNKGLRSPNVTSTRTNNKNYKIYYIKLLFSN